MKMKYWICQVLAVLSLGMLMLCSTVSALTQEEYDKLRVYSDVLSLIEKNYVEEKDPSDVIYESIKGMVRNLDPHSSFMPPSVYRELQVETKGKFGGLGIEITIKDRELIIVSPIEDTPAFRAGLKSGDRIIKIEETLTKNMDIMDAIKLMRGKPGTKIRLTVHREGFSKPKAFTIVRDVIKIKSVKSELLQDKYAYIRIAQFQENTTRDFKRTLKRLSERKKGIAGLIIDLRSNPGGLLTQAVKVIDLFIDEGLIVYTDGRITSQNLQYHAHDNSEKFNYHMVVLVNEGSASASEIVAGVFQDHHRAIVIGNKTFGKGTVQTIFPLVDGSGLRLTTAKYYLPSHRTTHGKGIEPDILVKPVDDNATLTTEELIQRRNKSVEDDVLVMKAVEILGQWDRYEPILSKH